MTYLPDRETVLSILAAVARPTAPYHEQGVLAAIRRELTAPGVALSEDAYGQIVARVRRGGKSRPLVLVAHTDHPAFEVLSAQGTEGIARVLGRFRGRVLDEPVAVRVHADGAGDGDGLAATVDRFVPDSEPVHNSPGRVRIRAEAPMARGWWATLDLPALEVAGDEIRMAAADDLAGCAVVVLALRELSRADGPLDVSGVFTRAEETGLYGARILAEDGAIPRDALVVSVEASRALPHTPAGGGAVVRVGDLHNTFANDAERFLRAAAERLAESGVRTQRALLDGGTCEASTFVVHGWSATAVALPNVNYHDCGPDGRLAPETVRLGDLRSAVALLVEAARTLAEDAREAWWTTAGPVPGEVRARLHGAGRT